MKLALLILLTLKFELQIVYSSPALFYMSDSSATIYTENVQTKFKGEIIYTKLIKSSFPYKESNRSISKYQQQNHNRNNVQYYNFFKRLKRSENTKNVSKNKEVYVHSKDGPNYSTFDNHWKNKRGPYEEVKPTTSDGIINTTSDYVLIAMIVAMMFCMTLCCLCLFCRSSSRLSICGINFELNDRQNSLGNEDLSEIHEVVPLTPTTADNNRLPDIESILRSDAPPPLYTDLVNKNSSKTDEIKTDQSGDHIRLDKIAEANENVKKYSKVFSKKQEPPSQTGSSTSSANNKSSWRRNGKGIFSSLRLKPKSPHSASGSSATTTSTKVSKDLSKSLQQQQMQTSNKQDKTQTNKPRNPNKVFVYDIAELEDDDVFI